MLDICCAFLRICGLLMTVMGSIPDARLFRVRADVILMFFSYIPTRSRKKCFYLDIMDQLCPNGKLVEFWSFIMRILGFISYTTLENESKDHYKVATRFGHIKDLQYFDRYLH